MIWVAEARKEVFAHRMSWTIHRGDIPDGLFVLHKCDNPICVNPDHLFLGNAQDNMTDKVRKGRQSRQRGTENPMAALDDAKVKIIRSLYRRGVSQPVIALQFGVAQTTVSGIVRKKQWRHVG
jgi:hypothetical protein